jgi:C-terminal processing protease CtpA/Prc
MRWSTRFPLLRSLPVRVEFANPGQAAQTVFLPVEREFDSFFYSPDEPSTGWELPVEYRILDDGIVYARITSFFDTQLLTIQLWERMIRQMNDEGVRGLIIDMRQNGGGSGFLADQMAAYFFQEETVVGRRASYNKDLGAFFFDSRRDSRMYPPSDDLQYRGRVVVLIGPDCASACERFAYNMTIGGRAELVGFYPTAGLGGGVEDFRMPEGVTVRMTVVRSTDVDGNIHIEGTGVAPTLRVPVTREALFATTDVLLETARGVLTGR